MFCSYANFRTSYRRIGETSYTVYPDEWICTVKELAGWFRPRFQHQALDILDGLQKRNLISYLSLRRGKVVKYKIRDWKKHNTVLDSNCPCQKDTGFFFIFRQAADSRIAHNARLINAGSTELYYGEDFKVVDRRTQEQAAETLMELCCKEIEENGIERVQILSPHREDGETSVDSLNGNLFHKT